MSPRINLPGVANKLLAGNAYGNRAVQPAVRALPIRPTPLASPSAPAVLLPPTAFDGMARMGSSRLLFLNVSFGGGTGVWIWDPAIPAFVHYPGAIEPGGGGDQMMAWDGEKVVALEFYQPDLKTWAWDDSAHLWVDITTGNEPPDYLSGMTYDYTNDKLVAFGGVAGSTEHDQTWTWDRTVGANGDWNLESPGTSPSIRRKMYLSWDGTRVIAFGGMHSTGTVFGGPFVFHSDTWGWDGSDWTDLAPATTPAARASAFLAYDGGSGTIMWGGPFGLIEPTKTYTWDGTNWTQHTTADNPEADTPNAGEWDGQQVFHYPIGNTFEQAGMRWDGVAENWVRAFP